MTIPKPYINLLMECPECLTREFKPNTPDIVMGHLVETHGYNVGEADDAIKAWMDEFQKDGDGYPLATCEGHGFYRADGVCYGCEASDHRIKGDR